MGTAVLSSRLKRSGRVADCSVHVLSSLVFLPIALRTCAGISQLNVCVCVCVRARISYVFLFPSVALFGQKPCDAPILRPEVSVSEYPKPENGSPLAALLCIALPSEQRPAQRHSCKPNMFCHDMLSSQTRRGLKSSGMRHSVVARLAPNVSKALLSFETSETSSPLTHHIPLEVNP